MRRNIVAAVSGLLAVALLGISATPAAADPAQDFVRGKGSWTSIDLSINARSGPLGEDPRGAFTQHSTHPVFGHSAQSFRVTCLAVQGNRAVAGGYNPQAPDAGYLALIEDNAGLGVPDRAGTTAWSEEPPDQALCQAALGGTIGGTVPVEDGDFTVNDE